MYLNNSLIDKFKKNKEFILDYIKQRRFLEYHYKNKKFKILNKTYNNKIIDDTTINNKFKEYIMKQINFIIYKNTNKKIN